MRHWLEADPGRPFFLYLHNIEPHGPYGEDAPALGGRPRDGEGTELNRTLARYSHQTRVDFEAQRPIGTTDNTKLQQRTMKTLEANREKILELYEKDVALADATLGGVVAELRRAGLWNEILFILVSDHGEEFGEHGGWHHDQSVYEELLRVPLLIRLPGARSGGTRVSEPVSLVDLLPTLAELLELSDLADGARGRSLLPWMGGSESKKSPRRRALPRVTSMRINRKKFYRPFKEKRGDVNVVVRDGRWKAIWNVEANAIELYDLKADAGEKFDWAAREPKRARKLRRVAKQWQARCGAAGARAASSAPAPERPIDPDSRERLRALGYLDAED